MALDDIKPNSEQGRHLIEDKELFQLGEDPPAGLDYLNGEFLAGFHELALHDGTLVIKQGAPFKVLLFNEPYDPPLQITVTVSNDPLNRNMVVVGPGGTTTEGVVTLQLASHKGYSQAFITWDRRLSVTDPDELGNRCFCLAADFPRIKRRHDIARDVLKNDGITTPEQLKKVIENDKERSSRLQAEIRRRIAEENL